jgi:hypothetical protein
MPAETSGQLVLKPHREPSSRVQHTIQLEVNSRDRNYKNDFLSNPFKFNFDTPLKDVCKVELIGGTIPGNPYNITEYNNKFSFYEGTTTRVITITPGYYTTESLILALPALLNAGSTSTYTITLNTIGCIVIRQIGVSNTFGFEFATGVHTDLLDTNNGTLVSMNTLSTLLGFDLTDYYSVPGINNTLTAPYPVDMVSVNSRIYLYINADNMQNLGCISRGSGRRSPFAIIYFDVLTNGYKYLNKETVSPVSYSTPQPFARLRTLVVDFRDEFYRPINFNGKDFTLLLEFTVLV